VNPQALPLALYVHVPWCVRKCPYCDFNSHAVRGEIPEQEFVDAVLRDLRQEMDLICERPLCSIFFGGGTPSLLSGAVVKQLLRGIRNLCACVGDIEISLEANPGAADTRRFQAFRTAGVNRLSIGIQSFGAAQLESLGRIHGPREARAAVAKARDAGFHNLNLDLMFGLPGQDLTAARADVEAALELEPEHISYYQLTLEPNTPFSRSPPRLPDGDLTWEIHEQGRALLGARDFAQYEISAYARPGRLCRHNVNYWQFGDYLGVGPGAHGKLTCEDGSVRRRWKPRHPEAYLSKNQQRAALLAGSRRLNEEDLLVEFLLNALRLAQGFSRAQFEERTGLPFGTLQPGIRRAESLGLLAATREGVRPTGRGLAFLNDLLGLFT
jgi:oxygen-independent coproporphyrinogen-3 oxidase